MKELQEVVAENLQDEKQDEGLKEWAWDNAHGDELLIELVRAGKKEGVDFMNNQGIERAPGQYPANDPTFTRDRHLLKTSVGGNGRRLCLTRFS